MKSARSQRGMTLVEIMVVIVLVALLTVAIGGASAKLPAARLRRSSTSVTSAIRVAYFHAAARSRTTRLVFDIEKNLVWMEESDAPMLVQTHSVAASAGADPATLAEKAAITEGKTYNQPPQIGRATYRMVPFDLASGTAEADEKGKLKLQPGIRFRHVQSTHDDEPRANGRAYLYFWPGGQTERAVVQLSIGDKGRAPSMDETIVSVETSPLTGKATVYSEARELKAITDETELSERKDEGR